MCSLMCTYTYIKFEINDNSLPKKYDSERVLQVSKVLYLALIRLKSFKTFMMF